MKNKEHSVNRIQQALGTLVDRIDTPLPIVLSDVMQDNIDRMQAFATQQNLDVRPHVKTHNEYNGFLPLPGDGFHPRVGSVLPVVPNHVCPVVVNFEEYIVTDSTGAPLERWPVDARGFLN